MRKIIFLCLFIFLSNIILYSNELNQYAIKMVNTIITGNGEGEIGWQEAIAGRHSGPSTFAMSTKYIYIPDRVNYRINVYDYNLNFIKKIIEKKKESHFASSIKVDKNENLITLLNGKGLKKINHAGETIFYIKCLV